MKVLVVLKQRRDVILVVLKVVLKQRRDVILVVLKQRRVKFRIALPNRAMLNLATLMKISKAVIELG